MNFWGRIFFEYDERNNLSVAKGQPLENHVGNCRKILEQFRESCFNPATRDRLLKAAELHDDGKRHTFRIYDKEGADKKYPSGRSANGDSDRPGFSYSFAGHRFQVPGSDAYIDALIRSHHEFSVEQVNNERAMFEPGSEERKSFADDLYLLCMADQLEAELAVKTVEKKTGSIPRTFMEFATERIAEEAHAFSVVPWPFKQESFALVFELLVPEAFPAQKVTARKLREIFENGLRFEKENIQITLRRN